MLTALFLLPHLQGCGSACGPGTYESDGACLPEESDTDADTDADSDADADTDSDSDADTDADVTVCDDGGSFTTIQEAVDATVEGDAVTICAGTYVERLDVDHPLTLRSLDGPDATLLDADEGGTALFLHAGGAVTIEGLSVVGGRADRFGAVDAVDTDVSLVDCIVSGHDSGQATMSVDGGSLAVVDSRISDNTSDAAAVAELTGAGLYLERVEITGNTSASDTDPIDFWMDGGDVEAFNLLVHDEDVGSVFSGVMDSLFLVNSTFSGRMSAAWFLEGGDPVVEAQNNIFYSEEEVSTAFGAYFSDPVVRYNLYFGFNYPYCPGTCQPFDSDDTNLQRDPRFTDVDAGDFTLDEFSPCIDAGNPAAAYSDPDGTRNDMGAYGGPKSEW